jgi:hypothetical protein
MLVIPALGRLKQEDQQFQARAGDISSLAGCLPNMHKALSSILSIGGKGKSKKQNTLEFQASHSAKFCIKQSKNNKKPHTETTDFIFHHCLPESIEFLKH